VDKENNAVLFDAIIHHVDKVHHIILMLCFFWIRVYFIIPIGYVLFFNFHMPFMPKHDNFSKIFPVGN